MLRFNGTNFVASMPAATNDTPGGYMTDAINSENGQSSVPDSQWANGIQEEIQSVIAAGGVTPTTAVNNMQTSISNQISSLPGTTNGGFYANLGGTASEGDIGAAAPGVANAYLYNNGSAWGLYSSTGGNIISYQRGTSQIEISGTLQISTGTAANHAVTLTQLNTKAALAGSSSQSFSASSLNTQIIESTTGALFLESNSYTASVNIGNTAYVQHYVATATEPAAAVNLNQLNSYAPYWTYTHGSTSTGYWRKSPDGFIDQWGTASTSSGGSATIYLPINMTTSTYSIQITVVGTANGDTAQVNGAAIYGNGFTVTTTASPGGSSPLGPVAFQWSVKGY